MAKDYNPSRRNREAFEALTETPGNVPPQAVELEEAVLGALMLEKDSIIAVQEYVTPDAFYTEEHRTIYKAIEELSMELKPIDLYTVTERLKGKKELKKVGGASYLAQLTQKVGSAANVEFHAKIIAQKYVQRELIRSATEIQKRSYDESTDVTELIGYAEGEIFKVAEGHVKRSVQVSKDILARALMQIEEASKNTSAFNGVPSGFMAIDRVTLGWQLSDLIIIAARPSMGKTAFVLSMARNMAVDHEQGVAFFSLEMSAVQLMMRLIIAETGLSGNDVKSGRLTPEQYENGRRLMTLAYAMIFTLPGIPSIYYGDEIGMQGYKDPFNRAFFDWESRETRIRPVLQNLAALRKSCPAFADGTLAVTQAQGGVLCYERRAEAAVAAVCINRTEQQVRTVLLGRTVEVQPCSFAVVTDPE